MNERIVVHPPKKDKNEKYYVTVSYYLNGVRRQKRKTGFKKSAEAKAEGLKIRQKLEEEMPVIKATGTKESTLREFSEEYMLIRTDWAPGTLKIRNRGMARCDFADKKLNEITKMDLAKNVKKMEKIYAWNTIDAYLSTWHLMLNAAVEYGYLNKAPKYDHQEKEDDQDIIENVLSLEDAELMLKKITDRSQYLVTLIALTSGARRGELADINVNDIDFETGVWKIHHQWKYRKGGYRRYQKLKTKNSYREVPLPPRVITAIKAYPHRTIDGFLFGRGLKTLMEDTCGLYKTIGYEITLHGLRHTYITNLIRSRQFDLQSIAKMAGDSIQTITKTYMHYLEEMKQENIEKIKILFG